MSSQLLTRLGAILFSAALLCGALPGEMHGCDTDLSDEVNHIEYCTDRCAALCERVTTCGLYLPPDDAPDDAEVQELCAEECERHYYCVNPQLCTEGTYEPYPYISIEEAQACINDWKDLSCNTLNLRAPECGNDFGQCPEIATCRGDELCDPPEWE